MFMQENDPVNMMDAMGSSYESTNLDRPYGEHFGYNSSDGSMHLGGGPWPTMGTIVAMAVDLGVEAFIWHKLLQSLQTRPVQNCVAIGSTYRNLHGKSHLKNTLYML